MADYAEVVNLAPGTFSLNPNGIGLGQGKTFFRGFSDGQYTMTFDGIPFEDTNSPTHHSWANFPSGWTASADFDRSPGLASNFGPTNFGGSINLQSPQLFPDPDIRASASYGSLNTRLLQLDADSGFFGQGNKNSFLMDIQQLLSDGYQTFNRQKRVAGYGKYQYRFSDRTSLTLYGGLVDIWTNTPNTTNPTRAQVAQFGDNFLLDGTPLLAHRLPDPYYYGYNFYHVQTDFEYAAYTHGPWQWMEVRRQSLHHALLEQTELPERRHRQPHPCQAQRRRQAERIPACRRHRDSEQGNQVGHFPHRRLV